MKILFMLLVSFFGIAYSVPSIVSINGTFSDGGTVTLSGSGFGVNMAVGTSALEFLGGKNGPIENGTINSGFSRTNWNVDGEFGGNIVYSTNNVLFGTKLLYMTGTFVQYEVPLYYHLPSNLGSGDHIFVSWWERIVWAGNGQYKIIRFSTTQTIVDNPGHQDVYFFHNNSGGTTFGIDGGPYALYPSFSPATPQSTWTRMDIDIATSSSGTGSVTLTKYTPGSSLQTIKASNYTSQATGDNLNWIVWQNYFGTDAAGSMTSGTVWLDDIFIQHGTQARVELCDASTWGARKKCIIQYPASWADGSIAFTVNQGDFAASAGVFLYIVDAGGAVNAQGFPVTFGQETGTKSAGMAQNRNNLNGNVSVYDAMGKKINLTLAPSLAGKGNLLENRVRPNGIYFTISNENGKRVAKKFVVMK